MMEIKLSEEAVPAKYSVELRQSAKGDWYISSVQVKANTKEELKQVLDEAVEAARKKIGEVKG